MKKVGFYPVCFINLKHCNVTIALLPNYVSCVICYLYERYVRNKLLDSAEER